MPRICQHLRSGCESFAEVAQRFYVFHRFQLVDRPLCQPWSTPIKEAAICDLPFRTGSRLIWKPGAWHCQAIPRSYTMIVASYGRQPSVPFNMRFADFDTRSV